MQHYKHSIARRSPFRSSCQRATSSPSPDGLLRALNEQFQGLHSTAQRFLEAAEKLVPGFAPTHPLSLGRVFMPDETRLVPPDQAAALRPDDFDLYVNLRSLTIYARHFSAPAFANELGLRAVDIEVLRLLIRHPNEVFGDRRLQKCLPDYRLYGQRLYNIFWRLCKSTNSPQRRQIWIARVDGVPKQLAHKGHGYRFVPGRRKYCLVDWDSEPQASKNPQ